MTVLAKEEVGQRLVTKLAASLPPSPVCFRCHMIEARAQLEGFRGCAQYSV